jgi:8-oxo-dGTP diphosphatase
MTKRVHVAAGVIVNAAGEVLIARRPDHTHQGGLWEFPGGKVERGEQVPAALHRELHEELGITVQIQRPLIRIHHDYPDKSVLLDVWLVVAFSGEPHGREGQPIEWVMPARLRDYAFPAANQAIICAAQLPPAYLITPEPVDEQAFLAALEASLQGGIKLVQLRAHSLSDKDYMSLAKNVLERCRAYGAQLLLNRDPNLLEHIDADGVHLNSARLLACRTRPVDRSKWLTVSCHNEDELALAEKITADFAVVSPVMPTRSHAGVQPLGWEQFQLLSEKAAMPVYALGGMQLSDLPKAWQHGGQGIAAIGSLWST